MNLTALRMAPELRCKVTVGSAMYDMSTSYTCTWSTPASIISAPLSGVRALYCPEAFDHKSLAKIQDAYSPHERIALSKEEAVQFACNVINIGGEVLMHTAGSAADHIRVAGYRVSELPWINL